MNKHKLVNAFQTVFLIGGMSLLLSVTAELLLGGNILPWVFWMTVFSLIITVRISPGLVLRMYNARPLDPSEASDLYHMVEELARRAELPAVPRLFLVRTPILNAFTVGSRYNASIAVTDGLLRGLTMRELAGVLAHEVGHLKNNDIQVMALADAVGRLTASLSMAGQILILINLPIVISGQAGISWTAILLLTFAPTISSLLQLAVSRVREFDADLEAARLTGDPAGLASALEKMERYEQSLLKRLFFPGMNNPSPSILRTHPPTEERIRRLMEIEKEGLKMQQPIGSPDSHVELETFPHADRPPRNRMMGLGFWY